MPLLKIILIRLYSNGKRVNQKLLEGLRVALQQWVIGDRVSVLTQNYN